MYAFLPNSLLLFEPECDRTLLQPVQPTLGKIQGMEEISKIETTAYSMPYIATNKRFSVLLKKYIFCYYLNQSQYQINSSVGFAVEAAFLVFRNSCFHVPIINLNYHSRDKKCEITLIIGYFNENDARQAQGNITFLDISFQSSVFLGTNPNFFSWVVRWMAGGPNGTGLTPQKTSNFWRKNA